jgi:hypothetical protein
MQQERKEEREGQQPQQHPSGREGTWGGSWAWPYFTEKGQVKRQLLGPQEGKSSWEGKVSNPQGLFIDEQSKVTTPVLKGNTVNLCASIICFPTLALFFFVSFFLSFAVLGPKLRAFTLSHSTSPNFVKGFLR